MHNSFSTCLTKIVELKKERGTGEKARGIKFLLHKLENIMGIPRNHRKTGYGGDL